MKKTKSRSKKNSRPIVAIVMGSDSDLPVMKAATEPLKLFGISYKLQVVSAHRTPKEMVTFAERAKSEGYQIIIAGAGGAAHLPGMIASLSSLPVIGVPVSVGTMKGLDALLSIVQMPKGVPVATVAVNNSYNAGLLAAKILGAFDSKIAERISKYKDQMRKQVLKKKI
ncbi:MAG: 5-(carboxyamino)imidazole ribonucleotide mutase [Deltaproteobacteria bacterium]|nr:5-(carboxyamino)imidazole ribonucleotide mutase [Deltaproteobacteria bacterium]